MLRTFNMKMVILSTVVVLTSMTALAGCGSQTNTVGSTPAASPKTEIAKGTGKLVVYAALNEDDIVQIQKKFKEDTGIEVEYLRTNGAGEASTRVQAEKASPKADVIIGGSVEFYGPLADQGLLEKYSSPNNKELDSKFNDSNGFWQGWYMGVLGIVLNTERFKKDLEPKGVKEPKTWDDLLDPAYKGLFVTANPATAGSGYIFVADQLFRLGEEKGWDYVKNLHANVHHYIPAAGDVINLTATGEFVAGMSWAHDIVKSQQKGYPIKVIIPEQTAFEIGGAAIVKGGANIENAKKFIDWLLTKPVGEMNTKVSNRYSVRKDVAPPQGMIKIEDVKLVNYDRDKAAKMKPDALKKFTEVTGQGAK
ncbi:ABC transporter substrate-binding protein [Paenibacillus frigoriresistens]|uniref:ABC transporter substrate-binding protein n=1 Tax=Paenibacillus alginolyticus TaxID=59839 RepID=UPI001567BB16|nr:ABC transporter substrate-binding protein [Paenibacillus frigoriresistens]NRF92871.1 ABC transporter substrate-binding protein [Paenibacillus frigoriresistens]